MTFDGITLRAVKNDLEKYIGSRISKINQPNPTDLVITINNLKQRKLLISVNSNNPRLSLVFDSPDNPDTPTNFCMLLRKHLQGAYIEDIKQYGLDRILEISTRSLDEMGDVCTKKLIIEIMGKYSNIILINQDGEKVIDAIKRVSYDMSRVRQIFPGTKYVQILDDKENILGDEIKLPSDFIDKEKASNLYKVFYTNYTGFSPLIGKEIIYRAGLDTDIKQNLISDEEIKKIDKIFIELIEVIKSNSFKPCLIQSLEENKIIRFYPLTISHLGNRYQKSLDISEAIENYYKTKVNNSQVYSLAQDLEKFVLSKIKKDENKLLSILDEYEESKNRDIFLRNADLISSNFYRIKKGDKKIELENFFSENLEKVEIKLDEKLSPQENAQFLYKKYAKFKNREKILSSEIDKTKIDIDYLKQVLETIKLVSKLDELKEIKVELIENGYTKQSRAKKLKNIKESKPLQFINSKGNIIFVGKNNLQNDKLTLKTANKDDFFFHVKNSAGSHVILRNSKNIAEEDIYDAAFLAAKYSSLKNEKSVEIDYCLKKNVYKAKGAKPGMVFYTDFKTILVDLTDKELYDILMTKLVKEK